jgi:hypothetical protein
MTSVRFRWWVVCIRFWQRCLQTGCVQLLVNYVISDSQSAFIRGRLILDGILVANEIVDEAHRCKKELILFKVDFEKAYDSIDWSYLDEVMLKMGFPTPWWKWIKECIGTTSVSVLVNGSPTDEFFLRWGLRQGDPFSPFLFLLAAEGFHVLMESCHQIIFSLVIGWELFLICNLQMIL